MDERHKPGDMIPGDLTRAAQNHGIEPEQAADTIHAAAKKLKQEGAIG